MHVRREKQKTKKLEMTKADNKKLIKRPLLQKLEQKSLRDVLSKLSESKDKWKFKEIKKKL